MSRHAILYATALALCLCLSACVPGATYHGQDLTADVHRVATYALYDADTRAEAIARFLLQGHQGGYIPREVLNEYATSLGPDLQAALDASRIALKRSIGSDKPEDTATLLSEVARLMELLAQATAIATKYGY
jgi:hypothetical protein